MGQRKFEEGANLPRSIARRTTLDTPPTGLKGKAKDLLVKNPGLYRAVSGAYRSLSVLKGMATVAQRGQDLMMGQRPIVIAYGSEPRPRWGHGSGPHPGLDAIIGAGRARYEGVIRQIAAHRAAMEAVPESAPADGEEACWQNSFMSGLDAAALYGIVSSRRPKLYLEVGSGYSTRLVARAKRDQKLETRIISIDPMPRAAVDSLCDEVVRSPMEDVDLATFDRLDRGDVLFFDGSHHAFMNSDVVTLFLDVLPRLKAGVIVHIHDIFLPYDYPPDWIERYYTEQYVLAMALLAKWSALEILFPCQYVAKDPALSTLVQSQLGPRADLAAAASFWLEICG
jgi:predicted O-methyltransferase YrrM